MNWVTVLAIVVMLSLEEKGLREDYIRELSNLILTALRFADQHRRLGAASWSGAWIVRCRQLMSNAKVICFRKICSSFLIVRLLFCTVDFVLAIQSGCSSTKA